VPKVVTRWPRWHEDAHDVPVVPRRGPGRGASSPGLGCRLARQERGGVRAFGACCFAGKLRSPACPSGGGGPVTVAGARGFLLAKGANGPSTPISFPGAPRTIATGINDQGQVVGAYENTAAAPSPQPTGTPPMGRMSWASVAT
jgi:hypothetical protein